MRQFKIISALISLLFLSEAFAYGTGYSSYPLKVEQNFLSAEFTGITSTGGGIGVQGRFTRKVNEKLIFDGGVGFSGGERSGRAFVGADLEIFPDYMRQPRVTIKSTIENSKEFDKRRNIIAIAPMVSKGFSFWGHEAFPYVSLPVQLNLNSDDNTFETGISANIGINGHLPIEGYKHLIGSVEGIVGINDSFTGIFAGLTFPLNN